jgi:hypothetical protein
MAEREREREREREDIYTFSQERERELFWRCGRVSLLIKLSNSERG